MKWFATTNSPIWYNLERKSSGSLNWWANIYFRIFFCKKKRNFLKSIIENSAHKIRFWSLNTFGSFFQSCLPIHTYLFHRTNIPLGCKKDSPQKYTDIDIEDFKRNLFAVTVNKKRDKGRISLLRSKKGEKLLNVSLHKSAIFMLFFLCFFIYLYWHVFYSRYKDR